MAEQNEQDGGLSASPAVIVVALVAAIALPLLGFYSAQLLGGKPAGDLSEAAVEQRIRPEALVALADNAGSGAKAVQSPEDIYKNVCSACHDTGAAGAPKKGDKAAWAPRIALGQDKLIATAIKGIGAMPPKGGANVSDEVFAGVVVWLVNQSGAHFKAPAAAAAKAETAAAPAAAAPTPAAPAPAPTPAKAEAEAPAPVAAAPAATGGHGKKIYDATCMACHASGVAGAPKFGDKAAWAPRIASGFDTLLHSALKGKGAMPPKGGNSSIPDADIRAAVEYMVAAGK